MKEVDHPNIVKLFQVIETPEITYLVMEYAEGGEVKLITSAQLLVLSCLTI